MMIKYDIKYKVLNTDGEEFIGRLCECGECSIESSNFFIQRIDTGELYDAESIVEFREINTRRSHLPVWW